MELTTTQTAKKPYGLGIIVGRFQTLHTGHQMMISKAAELCDTVGIFVGSSQESGTFKNPFTYAERERMLKILFGDEVNIFPLPDLGVGNNSKWGEYVIGCVVSHFGKKPDIMISGKEARRTGWLDSEEYDSISELFVPKTIDISATRMREMFLEDDFESWKKCTDPRLWDMYDELKEKVISSKDNLETKSI